MNCPLCPEKTQSSGSDLCSLHAKSLENLRTALGKWDAAYGGISLEDFLKRIKALPGTGKAAKQVAQHILENPSRWK